jgi:hypothetical protein
MILLNLVLFHIAFCATVESSREFVYAKPGSNVSMSCQRSNRRVIWYGMLYEYDLSNDTIRLNDYHNVFVTVLHSIDSNWDNITLTNVIEHHGGTYTCKTNEFVITTYVLTVFNSIPPITCNIYKFNGNTGYINWLVDLNKNGNFSYLFHANRFVSNSGLNYGMSGNNLIMVDKIPGIYACYMHVVVNDHRINLELLYNLI